MSDIPPPPEGHILIGDYLAALDKAKAERRPAEDAMRLAEHWAQVRRDRARKGAA